MKKSSTSARSYAKPAAATKTTAKISAPAPAAKTAKGKGGKKGC